ncbi:hypothetical protein AN218_23035 [Streptomyces nanshensis]|uniref:Uncharacterized protein n=1 Tax=Streptomyces nanshensis TaxID=518642 RepID=A0A1E7KZK6_9ACTN|nr:hypothetical protein AN218_23035 [Streptomyces nanshensis]
MDKPADPIVFGPVDETAPRTRSDRDHACDRTSTAGCREPLLMSDAAMETWHGTRLDRAAPPAAAEPPAEHGGSYEDADELAHVVWGM